MKKISHIFILMVCFTVTGMLKSLPALGWDVYLVIYTTHEGQTGHAGIAIDNYQIEVSESHGVNTFLTDYDTVRTGTLTYYDLWPKQMADFTLSNIANDREPLYCRYPDPLFNKTVTVFSIMHNGVPTKAGQPCDGLIRIKTSPEQDFKLQAFMEDLIDKKRPFNPRYFNCADFARLAVEFIAGKEIDGREYILDDFSTTPNALYKAVFQLVDTEVLKDPGKHINQRFFNEKSLYEMLFGNPVSEQ